MHGETVDRRMMHENPYSNMDSLKDTIPYVGPCVCFDDVVLKIQAVQLGHRYAKSFRA